MAQLNESELAFLASQGVPLSRLFDAEHLSAKVWKQIMSERRLWVAFGTTPCLAAGYRLRTRKGHCVQCDTSKLAFLKRYDLSGSVYIAYSKSTRLVKVGCADCILQRRESLNADGYAGGSDWVMKYYIATQFAGRMEFKVHELLRRFKHPVRYFRVYSGSYVWANEVFRCSISAAKSALEAVTSKSES